VRTAPVRVYVLCRSFAAREKQVDLLEDELLFCERGNDLAMFFLSESREAVKLADVGVPGELMVRVKTAPRTLIIPRRECPDCNEKCEAAPEYTDLAMWDWEREEDLIDYDAGAQACLDNLPLDPTASEPWQCGWHDVAREYGRTCSGQRGRGHIGGA
jgi:hypothetical protein